MFDVNGSFKTFSRSQIIEMIEHFEVSLNPQAAEYLEHLEYHLLSIEEREDAGIA